MTKARDYLISKSLAVPGRGRYSREATAELERAAADGMTFDDWPRETVTETVKVGRRNVTVTKTVAKSSVEPEAKRTFPEDARYFVVSGKKKVEVTEATACGGCRNSIGWCRCVVLVDGRYDITPTGLAAGIDGYGKVVVE